jgi:hypothetical protein
MLSDGYRFLEDLELFKQIPNILFNCIPFLKTSKQALHSILRMVHALKRFHLGLTHSNEAPEVVEERRNIESKDDSELYQSHK